MDFIYVLLLFFLNFFKLSNFKNNNVIYMSFIFSNCYSLTFLNLSNFNTNNVNNMNNMNNMFSNCSSLTSLNLLNFITNNVIDMTDMFHGLNKICDIIPIDNNLLNLLTYL